MKWVVTGAGGMLGMEVLDVLTRSGDHVTGLTRAGLDVRDALACRTALAEADVVVHCAAWTDVDGAESHEADAFAVNAVGAANVARACESLGARMVQISSDYVFAGDATDPYPVDAPLDPLNAYGRTKAAGEWAVKAECSRAYVVRTAWLYGEHGPNFVRTMLRLAQEREVVEVVTDQRGQPTWTRDLAHTLRELVVTEAPFGTYHGTSSGETTWFDLARRIYHISGLDPSRVRPVTSNRYPRPANRPAYSVLASDSPRPDWHDSLARYLASAV